MRESGYTYDKSMPPIPRKGSSNLARRWVLHVLVDGEQMSAPTHSYSGAVRARNRYLKRGYCSWIEDTWEKNTQ
jgi:hypothetical protein